jgi:hypothetical protein
MLRWTLSFLAICCIATLVMLSMRVSSGRVWTKQWTTARQPALQGPVQGDWFTDMADATAWADEVEPPRHMDLGLFIYDRQPVVSVSGPAQPAVISGIRHGISIPFVRAVWLLCILPTCAGAMWLIHAYRIWLRARRGRQGLCPACGYDLRASKDRCPECGNAVSVAPGTI